jgi:hypothetical protein
LILLVITPNGRWYNSIIMAYKKSNPNGQATMANSEPVVIASDQSAIDVDVTASVLPTGAATEAKQDTIIGHVDGLETAVASTNTKLDTLITQTDGIEGLLTTIDADTDAIKTAVETLDNTIQTEGAVYAQGATQIIGGVRKDATGAPAGVADGDVHPFVFNEEGRLKTSTQPAIYTAVTGNITANGQTVSVDVSRASNLMFHMTTASLSNHNVTFEGSINGGTTWFAVQAVRTNANTVELTTGNLSATPAYAWEASVNALTHFRVRATGHASGTATWRFLPGAYATEPIPAIQTHAVTGSGNFAVTMAANATTTPAKARDGAAGASDTGIPNLFVRRDTPTAVTPAAGDWEIPQISANGEQWVRQQGELADDAAFTLGTTRVLPIGAVAVTMDGTDPATASAEGDAVVPRSDLNRILLVNQTHPRYFRASADYASAQTNTSLVSAPGAGLSLWITDIIISNGATAGNITLLDGSGGTVVLELYPAINGGLTHSFRNPIKLTANTALCVTSTTVTTHSVTVTGYIAA